MNSILPDEAWEKLHSAVDDHAKDMTPKGRAESYGQLIHNVLKQLRSHLEDPTTRLGDVLSTVDCAAELRLILKEHQQMRRLLSKLSNHCTGARYNTHLFAQIPEFIGCHAHRSADPNEYCCACRAEQLLIDQNNARREPKPVAT